LGEVTINGSTKESQIDKDVYLVTSDLKVGASNTKDVLSKVKGVNYDRYNNSIKVDGEENVIILVDGLQKDQEYIKNLAPDRLKKIEVMRDPSGRYALEGYSAVINVILKKDYKGVEVFVENRIIVDTDNENTDYVLPINNFSANFNYTYNKINLYSKYSHNYMSLEMLNTTEKEYTSGLEISKGSENDLANLQTRDINDNITIGADYYINPKHTISFESNFRGLAFNDNFTETNSHTIYLQDGNVFNELNIGNSNNSVNKSSNHSLFYIGNLDKNNSINIDFSYSTYSDNYINQYFEDDAIQRTEIGINNKTNTKLYAELNHIINQKSNVQIGYGNENKSLKNTFASDINLDFEFTDSRHKLYAYYSWNLNEKFGIKLGGAAETSMPKSGELETRYFIYQPYADVKYKPFKFLDVRLKYRSSSDYPSISEANPFTYIFDQETVQTGNPKLSPSVKHKASVKFQILQGLFSIEPYYHFSNDYITKTGFLREDGIFEYSYNNAGEYTHKGIKGNLTIPFGKSLFLQSGANFFRSIIEYDNKINELEDWTMNSQLIYVNKKTNTVGGLIFQNNMKKVITAQGYNKWANDFWGLFLQQPFLKQKLNVMLFYILPVNLGVDSYQGSYIKTDTYSEMNMQDLSILENAFMLQITYRFNKGKSVRKTDKEIKEEEEKTSKSLF